MKCDSVTQLAVVDPPFIGRVLYVPVHFFIHHNTIAKKQLKHTVNNETKKLELQIYSKISINLLLF